MGVFGLKKKTAQMGLLFPVHGVVIVGRLPCPGSLNSCCCCCWWMDAQGRIANQPAADTLGTRFGNKLWFFLSPWDNCQAPDSKAQDLPHRTKMSGSFLCCTCFISAAFSNPIDLSRITVAVEQRLNLPTSPLPCAIKLNVLGLFLGFAELN